MASEQIVVLRQIVSLLPWGICWLCPSGYYSELNVPATGSSPDFGFYFLGRDVVSLHRTGANFAPGRARQRLANYHFEDLISDRHLLLNYSAG